MEIKDGETMTDNTNQQLVDIDMDIDYALENVGNSMGTFDINSQTRYLLNSYAYMVSAQNKITNYLRSKGMAAPGLRLVDTLIKSPDIIEGSFVEIKDNGAHIDKKWVKHFDDCNYNMFATECNCDSLQSEHMRIKSAKQLIDHLSEQDDTVIEENY